MIDEEKTPDKQGTESLRKIIEQVCEDICDNYCRYRSTVNSEGECEAIRYGDGCPLDKLN